MREPSWTLKQLVAGAASVTLAEAKAHCTVVVADDDTLLTAYSLAAASLVESLSETALLEQTWLRAGTDFPCEGEPIVLPRPPLAEVVSVKYRDVNDALQTWDPSQYRVITVGRFGAIVPTIGNRYPVTRNAVTGDSAPDAVQIEFTCGYALAEDVPARLQLAQQLLIAHWYAQREAVNVGNIVTDVPFGVLTLIGSRADDDPCW